MNARRAVERLLEMSADPEHGMKLLDEYLDDTAIELLTILCGNLAFAAAAARGKSRHKGQARERAIEYVESIATVLHVWQSADVEVIDGPGLASSSLDTIFVD